jgi:hypothetical protein
MVVVVFLDILTQKLDLVIALVAAVLDRLDDRCDRNTTMSQKASILQSVGDRFGITALH